MILEKNDDLGGTWRDNKYPGCACDVPSHMYSFSFELNPDWSRMFAPQQEIWAYMRRCADKYGVAAHIHHGSEVERMEWDDAVRRWHVTTTSGEVYTARAVVSGSGGLHVPSVPEIAVQHVMGCLRLLARRKAETIEAKASALRRFNDGIQARLRRAVWSMGGCKSWYLDDEGVNRATLATTQLRVLGAHQAGAQRRLHDPLTYGPVWLMAAWISINEVVPGSVEPSVAAPVIIRTAFTVSS